MARALEEIGGEERNIRGRSNERNLEKANGNSQDRFLGGSGTIQRRDLQRSQTSEPLQHLPDLEERLLSSKEMTIKKIGGSLNKALMMKDIEDILGFASFEIDSKKYESKWKEKIKLGHEKYQEYKVAFRVTPTQKPKTSNNIRSWP